MAFNAYRPTSANDIDLSEQGWIIDTEISLPERGDGFDATVYRNGNQIVIAFRGTDGPSLADWDDNFLIGKGEFSAQVQHAIETVADVLIKYPGRDIQFTGHSSGGGLASIMAVFFDRPAYVFAPAPFQFSATNLRVDIDLNLESLPFALPLPALEIEPSTLIQTYFEQGVSTTSRGMVSRCYPRIVPREIGECFRGI